MQRLYEQYKKEVVPALKEAFGFKNVMEVPKVESITLNVGYGRHVKDKSFKENVEKTLSAITGQKPVHNKARMSISNFKIREGDSVLEDGCSFDEGKWIEKTTDDFFKGKRVV